MGEGSLNLEPVLDFQNEVSENLKKLSSADELKRFSKDWINAAAPYRYTYNFSWLGRPIIQFPNDSWALQEIIWKTKPDLIIETGIAHGGSLIMNASILALMDMSEAILNNQSLDPRISKRKVLGIDIDIRKHNQAMIDSHPMASRIEMIEGSSINPDVVDEVKDFSSEFKNIMVCLDSNHSHEHVLSELNSYAPLVSKGSYCVVFDTVVETMPKDLFLDRPWGPNDNPKTALKEYLSTHKEFVIDLEIDNKLMISSAPNGYLKRIS
ncbi:cephalosporin hydroxylase family protein [Prochlorococcus sp. MIT 0801]|uniref:cephalosporin hydroxylase family protein n=1 Tax=Prochlorococcus sp. MIT 0801 TaxID=1501269 RepID=UPI0004F6642F|nr:cephalosporin hydroxylase family protein [Prochlorococcus sp. MIT 0801]AIQ98267.1 Cephalosporin hydroxylase [Prochlorococcus sp. MIT 0801]